VSQKHSRRCSSTAVGFSCRKIADGRDWLDFGATALVAWCAFFAALLAPAHPAWVAALAAAAVFASYRALCFIHEIVHIRPDRLRGFARSWNAVIGIPFLFPLFLYDGMHRDHHSAAPYGSARDPQYVPLAGRRAAHLPAGAAQRSGGRGARAALPGAVRIRPSHTTTWRRHIAG
jgi:hypothetical protein